MAGFISSMLGWIENHPGTAAWAQTIGVFVALLIAIGVPLWQQRIANQERRAKARTLAIAIHPELLEIQARLGPARLAIASGFVTPPGQLPVTTIQAAKIEIPPTLATSGDRLWWLGVEAGATVQQLVAVLTQYERLLNHALTLQFNSQSPMSPQAVTQNLMPHLDVAKKLLEESFREIGPIHDRKV